MRWMLQTKVNKKYQIQITKSRLLQRILENFVVTAVKHNRYGAWMIRLKELV